MSDARAQNLYRREALASLSDREWGRPMGQCPRVWLHLAAMVLALIIVFGVFAGNLDYARKQRVHGWLVADSGVVRIEATTHARVAALTARPGVEVTAGTPLMTLGNESVSASGADYSKASLRRANQEIAELNKQSSLMAEHSAVRVASQNERSRQNERKLAAIAAGIERQRDVLLLGQQKLRALEDLAASGTVATWDVLKQVESNLAQSSEAHRLELVQEDLRSGRIALLEQLRAEPIMLAQQQSEIEARKLRLGQQIADIKNQMNTLITAPVDGTISTVDVALGASNEPGQLLATLLPRDSRLLAELYIPSRAAGFIHAGQRVKIAFDAFPRERFGAFDGTVQNVAATALQPMDIPTSIPVREASYKVSVAIPEKLLSIDAETLHLRPGLQLTAELILERRTLVEWLLEPLLAVRANLG